MSCCITSPRILRDERWVCAECGSISESDNSEALQIDDADLDLFDWASGMNPTIINNFKCECGAEKTINPSLHAFWCKKFDK